MSKSSKADAEKSKRELVRRKTRAGAKLPWFLLEGGDAATLLCQHVDHLRRVELGPYRRRVLENMRLYAGSTNVNGTDNKLGGVQLRYNLTRSVTDTGAAVLAAARTLPFCQTRGADWKLRRTALRRNQVLQTQFQQIGLFSEALKAINDALITGLGGVKVFEDPDKDGGTPSCERVLPLSIVWDPTEAVAGKPRNLYQVELVSKDVLIEIYARREDGSIDDKIEEAILDAPGASPTDSTDFQLKRSGTANLCAVTEGWHLPSSAEACDGRHTIAIPGCELHTEEWKRDGFPFGFLHGWMPGQLGFSGTSLVELVKPAQRRLEEIADFVRKCQILASGPRVFLPLGSNIEPEALSNAAMPTHLYEGTQPPVFFQFSGTPPDLEQARALIREETLSMLGLSQTQVQGEKPAGLNSGKAQQVAEDIQSKRHVVNLRHIEQFYLDCAEALIGVNDQIATTRADFSVDSGARIKWLESNKWKGLMLDPSQARTAVLPVSALVGSAASQFETTQEWIAAGWCDQQTAKTLAGHPDTEGQTEEDTEDEQYAQDLVETILDFDEKKSPVTLDPIASAEVFLSVARPAYLRARREKAPPEVLGEFRRVLDEARVTVQKSQPKAAAPVPQDPMQLPQAAIAA